LVNKKLVKRQAKTENVLYEVQAEQVWISVVSPHGLEDDCEIEFSRYQVEVDFTSSAAMPEAKTLALAFAAKIRGEYNCKVMVIKDLQEVVSC